MIDDELARPQFILEWLQIRKVIPSERIHLAANQYYDHACEMGAIGWDGSSQLEKDGGINQHLEEE